MKIGTLYALPNVCFPRTQATCSAIDASSSTSTSSTMKSHLLKRAKLMIAKQRSRRGAVVRLPNQKRSLSRGKSATQVVPLVTSGLVVAASCNRNGTTTPGRTPLSSPATTGSQSTVSSAKALSTSSSAKVPSKVAKANSGNDTLAKATPTPKSSIVPLPLASDSTLRQLSVSQSNDSSPSTRIAERTRNKTNANKITDDEWIVVRTKLAEG